MKIKFKKTEEQLSLARAMVSKSKAEAQEALEAFASIGSAVISKVLDQADVTSMIYTTEEFSENDPQVIEIDLYAGKDQNEVRVTSQRVAGGLATSEVQGYETVPFTTYDLFSAVSWTKRFARGARGLDIAAKGLARMAQEILSLQNLNRIQPVLSVLASATTNGQAHFINSTTADVFQLDDLNRLITLMRRINVSWDKGGTPDPTVGKLTDLLVSPEIMEQIRAFSYQPMNTRGVPNSDESTAVPLPDATREAILRGGGLPELFNVTLHELNELGDGRLWNTLFDTYYGGSFTSATDQALIGLDLNREAYIRPVVTEEGRGQVTVEPDDQFVNRAKKIGFTAEVHEGALCLDNRGTVGIRV